MDIQVAVLLFFIIMVAIGILLIIYGESQTFSDTVSKSYKLKIVESYEYCTLYYTKSYGIFWNRVPIRVGGCFKPKYITAVKSDDEAGMDMLLGMFSAFLNDQSKLEYHLRALHNTLKEMQDKYDAKQLTKRMSKINKA